jgi:Ca2+-binding RTX toxin-like protein
MPPGSHRKKEQYMSRTLVGVLSAAALTLPLALVASPAQAAVITGTNGDDTLYGTEAPDEISGLRGDDLLAGREGADDVFGGPGADDVRGQRDDDFLAGNGGPDVVRGADGDDFLRGGGGADVLGGGNDADELIGNLHDDVLIGASDADFLDPGWDEDLVEAGPGNDIVYVEIDGTATVQSSPDFIDCGDGDDTVVSPNDELDPRDEFVNCENFVGDGA